ncbi:hypothetical protein [Mucilaginibacter myungsuensis]|uniref:Bacteriocin-like protein n=1 Tax=Mucilaginibacter myungsuensis TaxID=649104 RepID=A0A929PVS2_9SPHI|nr:hypothetical protein [Mucilaginibacter myungsuensis]MBE9661414.1 hypothetical protein [Mucilaginibacter myungsuensis]MDN3597557.1 hypothetical protein [Mucilaginibacter myungsuensis]
MKTQELNSQELKAINGGGLFDDSSSNSGLMGSLGIGNLLSFSQASQDGDEKQASSLSLGNGIGLDLGSMFSQLTQ